MNKGINLFKNNMYCAIESHGFRLSIALSAILAVSQIIINYEPIITVDPYPSSVFGRWIGGEFHTFVGQLLYIVLPLLCAFPFQSQFFSDKQDGYLKNLALHVSRNGIFGAYYTANFLASFIAAVFPFTLNLLLSAMIYPALRPETILNFLPRSQNALMIGVFISHPWIYCWLYIFMIGIFMAALSNIGLSFSLCMQNKFFVIVFPFVSYFILAFSLEQFKLSAYCPLYFLQPSQVDNASWSIYFSYIIGMLTVSFVVFRNQVRTCEII